jgi:hypothetical protein
MLTRKFLPYEKVEWSPRLRHLDGVRFFTCRYGRGPFTIVRIIDLPIWCRYKHLRKPPENHTGDGACETCLEYRIGRVGHPQWLCLSDEGEQLPAVFSGGFFVPHRPK